MAVKESFDSDIGSIKCDLFLDHLNYLIMEQFVKDLMSKLSDFVVIWQFFRLVFRYL